MTIIVVAGAGGNLGSRIVREVLARGGEARALVRRESDKLAALPKAGLSIVNVEMSDATGLAKACEGAACVVSALQGLREVIVDAQTSLLDAAVSAGVPRFIPSDFSLDFTKTARGDNRNSDLRRDFQERLASRSIAATSILNGAFAELLRSPMMIDREQKRVTYWGDVDQPLDFTTMDDTARYTAAAALDATTPRYLRIAGDVKSAREIAGILGFETVRLGSIDDLGAYITRERAADPASEKQSFPRWQGAQYRRDMASGKGKLDPLDNDRYPMKWTGVRDVLAA